MGSVVDFRATVTGVVSLTARYIATISLDVEVIGVVTSSTAESLAESSFVCRRKRRQVEWRCYWRFVVECWRIRRDERDTG